MTVHLINAKAKLLIPSVLASLFLLAGHTQAQTVTKTVAAGSTPFSVAVNPVTNKVYVANRDSNNVTVIDGATNTTTTVAAGSDPQTHYVEPGTNKGVV